jgi:hypothetical protein
MKQVGEGTTRYYWYPGDKGDWLRAGLALASGLAGFAMLLWLGRSTLLSATVGASLTTAVAGVNLGRRDYRGACGFPDLSGKALRRAAVAHGRRAAWRALIEGCGGAAAAVLIANLPAGGLVANWLLPVVPATVGALAHQAGMMYERLATAGMPEDRPRVPAAAHM